MTRAQVAAVVNLLPARSPRPHEVQLPSEEVAPLAASDRADTATLDGERRELARRAGIVLCETMAQWAADDQLLVRLRFESSLTIAEIARRMKVPQRPLYRRLELLLDRLRAVLLTAGVDSAAANDLLDAADRM